MDIHDTVPDNPFGAVVDVSDKVMAEAEPVAYMPPKYFKDNIVEEDDLVPIHNPDTGQVTHARAVNSGDDTQKRLRLSNGVEGFEPGVSQAVVDFNPVNRKKANMTLPSNVSEYKQFLIEKITGGAQDFTYGPGSPGATSSDMRQSIGSRNNRLQTGDVALPQQDYNLFTPEEREKYHIADTSWYHPGSPTPQGSVERYYGPEARGQDLRGAIGEYPRIAGDPTAESIQAANRPTIVSKDRNGTALWSDGSRVYADGTISRPMGNSIKFTSADGKVRWANIDPSKQPIPPIPSGVTADSNDEDKSKAIGKLSQSDQVAVREYAADQRAATTRQGRVDPAYSRLAPYVKLLTPDHDPSQFPIRQQARMQYASTQNGMPGQKIDAFNQALTHAGNLHDLIQALPQGQYTDLNGIRNYINTHQGSKAVTNFDQQLEYLATEVSRGLRGGVPNTSDIERINKAFNASGSKEQLEGAIKDVMSKTIEGGLETISSGYKARLKKDMPADLLLYPDAKESLQKLGYSEFAHQPIGGKVSEAPKSVSKVGESVKIGNETYTVGEPRYNPQTNETKTFWGLDDNGQPILQ